LHAVIDVERVMVAKELMKAVVARGKDGAFGLVVRLSKLLGGANQIVVSEKQIVESALGFGKQRAARFELGILAQNSRPRPGMETHLPGIGFVDAREDPQEGGLPSSVGADEADALAGLKFETDAAKERIGVEGAGKIGTAE